MCSPSLSLQLSSQNLKQGYLILLIVPQGILILVISRRAYKDCVVITVGLMISDAASEFGWNSPSLWATFSMCVWRQSFSMHCAICYEHPRVLYQKMFERFHCLLWIPSCFFTKQIILSWTNNGGWCFRIWIGSILGLQGVGHWSSWEAHRLRL